MDAQIVFVYTADDEGQEQEMGSVIWDGDELTVVSNDGSDFMERLLEQPVFSADDEDISSNDDPQEWFNTLHRHYKGSRMWATEPRLLVDSDLEDTEVQE